MKKLIKLLLPALCTLIVLNANAQQWGYATLIAPQNSNSASLLDTNNTVIKSWSGLSGQTGYSSYLTEGGYLWRTVKTSGSFNGGGITGRVQKIAYNGTLLFDYTISNANECSHHDICPMPNGNVMLIVYEKKTAAEVTAAGCTANAVRWSEKIVELKPTGLNTADIVWQWKLWDHLVQNADPAKPNYQASIVLHPELLNVNYKNNNTDWVHMNGIDYNAELDQIVVSSHNLNEMWIIDHSTTTAEAAGHLGGNSGKGGDLLYRWGNPAAYAAAGSAVYNVVHDAHWVPENCPNAGFLAGFNNKGVSSNQSSIDQVNPPINGFNYDITLGQAYQPASYTQRHECSGYSSNMGNSQQLPNGNMLVCLATASKVYEIDAAGSQVWQYQGTGSIPQAWRYERCFVEAPSIVMANDNPSLCIGSEITLDITPTANSSGGFTYNWAPATGLSSTTVQDPVLSGLTDNITYSITITTAGGCTATATVPVVVAPGPAANAGDDVTINPGENVTLTATGGGNYLWSNGETTASISVSPAITTTYSVTVSDGGVCASSDQVTVFVNAGFQCTISATDTVICLGDVMQLFAHPSGGSGNYTYAWTATDFTSDIQDPYVNPGITTTYALSVSDGVETITLAFTVVVNPLPQQPTISETGQVLYSSASVGNQWYYYGNPISGETGVSFTPTLEGSYQVQIVDANGCFSPLSDPFEFIPVGTADHALDTSWRLFPNPATDIVTASGLSQLPQYTLELFNAWGEKLLELEGGNQMDVSAFPPGLYALRLKIGKRFSAKRFIVQHD